MVPPPHPIKFTQNIPNKALTGLGVLQNIENKRDDLQNIQNAGVMVSERDTNLKLMDSVSTLYLSVSAWRGERM
jgi:hypothetical protein